MLKLKRFEKNPILKGVPGQPFHSKYIYNAGATIYNNQVLLLYRAEGEYKRPGIETRWPLTTLGVATSDDGFHFGNLRCPVMVPQEEREMWGLEDPRVSKIDDTYYLVIVQVGPHPPDESQDSLLLATTKDFVTFKRHGRLMPEVRQRTSGLLPAKIRGEYVLIHRQAPSMQIAYSSDLVEWHGSKPLMEPRPGVAWEAKKIGIGAQPIRTDRGWLLFYHAVDANKVYRLSIAWLDLDDPSKVIGRLDYPILEPEADYEKFGLTKNVVYTCGAVEWQGRYLVYYGAADAVLAVASASVEEVHATL